MCLRHGTWVILGSTLVSLTLGFYAWRNLGFDVDPNHLFDEDLPFQQRILRFSEHFPVLTNSLLVVVDGETPDAVRDAADALAAALAARGDRIADVYFPGEESFFEAHGLLYLDVDDVESFSDELIAVQPALTALSRDPSIATLAGIIRQSIEHLPEEQQSDPDQLVRVLDHFRNAMVAVYAEYPVNVSWENVLLRGSGLDPTRRRVLVVDPVFDYDRILAAAPAMEAIREEIAALGLDDLGVRVRITGYPALNHEEFVGLARDTQVAGVLSFLLVLVVLFVAFRSWVIVGSAAATLLAGMLCTAGYAAATVGDLNPASIGFAVLFIGLGVDFMIHLGMAMVAGARAGRGVAQALVGGVRETGSALVLCSVTTAIGFLSFLPTDYGGLSELGVISAGGMVIVLFLTLTLFPVLIAWGLRGGAIEALRTRKAWSVPFPAPKHPIPVCVLAFGLGVPAVLAALDAELETNVIKLRNPDTESVETFLDLLGSDEATPWYLDMQAPDAARARELAAQVRELPEVRRAITLWDYVPSDQEVKIEMLGDLAFVLDLPEGVGTVPPTSVEEQIEVLRQLARFLDVDAVRESPSGLAFSANRLVEEIDRFLARVEGEGRPPDATAMAALDEKLLGGVPEQIDRLRNNLEPSPVTLETLPRGLVRRMLARDGQARVQVFPVEDLGDRAAMVGFVEAVRPVWSEITGLPVNLVASSYATWDSLREALVWAIVAISLVLLVIWRRPAEVAIALLPLGLAVILTAAFTTVFDRPLNFINICVLPLILGMGVDSGVHLVHRAQRLPAEGGELLSSTTAQAVFFSAITSLASFGTLVLSLHRGIATLGELLVVGMLFTLIGNLVLLPALVVLRERAIGRRLGRSAGDDEGV